MVGSVHFKALYLLVIQALNLCTLPCEAFLSLPLPSRTGSPLLGGQHVVCLSLYLAFSQCVLGASQVALCWVLPPPCQHR